MRVVRIVVVGAWLFLAANVFMSSCMAPRPDVIVTDDDAGGHVHARTGQLFDVVLADDYEDTGCQWRRSDDVDAPQRYDSEILPYLGQRYQPNHSPPARPDGATNTERYRAGEPGTTRVSLEESDNSGKVCRRYAIDVTVTGRNTMDAIVFALDAVVPFWLRIPLVAFLGCIALLALRPKRPTVD